MSTIANHIIIIALVLLSGCSTSPPDYKSENISFQFTEVGWKEIDPDKSNYATYKQDNHSLMVVNSYCKKYENTSLRTLRKQILAGIQNTKIIDTNQSSFKNRDILTTKAKGVIDGITRYFQINIFRKNRCLYDFMLITTTKELLKLEEKSLTKLMKGSYIP